MPQDLRTVKLRADVYRRLGAAVAEIAQRGWGAVGVTRTEVPTLSHILDEALTLFEEKLKKGKR